MLIESLVAVLFIIKVNITLTQQLHHSDMLNIDFSNREFLNLFNQTKLLHQRLAILFSLE
jgi:hypothetical protein